MRVRYCTVMLRFEYL